MEEPAHSSRVLRFGAFEANLQSGELRKSGLRIRLPDQSFQILAMLANRPGEVVTREQLQLALWPNGTFVDFDHSLNTAIGRLRDALGDSAESPRFVETLAKRGYRFVAPVETVNPGASSSGRGWTEGTGEGAHLDAGTLHESSLPAAAAGTVRRAIRRRRWIVGAAIGGLLGAIFALNVKGLREQLLEAVWARRAAPAAKIESIAVLPFDNLSGDPAQEYFSDGMTEELVTNLGKISALRVVSRTSVMRYKQTKRPIPELARELNVDAIVEGTVQRSGNHVRVTANLRYGPTDQHLWAETYERDVDDILALEDDVASAIAMQIENRLGGPQPLPEAKARAISPEAYETYLKANSYLDQFDLQKSIDYYNQAIKLDPNYAPAYAHMARSYFFLGFFSAMPPNQTWGKVKQLGMLAIEKDDRLPEGHGALALAKLHYDWDFAGAEREFKRALELNPSDADIRHDYAHYLMAMGRMDESATESKRAVDLDPIGDVLTGCLCWHSFAARQYDDSIQLARNGLTREPDDTWELAILGWDYEQKGLHEQAIAEFKKAVELSNKNSPPFSPFYLAGLGHAYAVAGRRSDAQQILQGLLDRAKHSYVSAFDIAVIYVALGDKDTAFAWLNKAVTERSTFLVYSKWDPRLDPLRSDPRFQVLLRRIGLTG